RWPGWVAAVALVGAVVSAVMAVGAIAGGEGIGLDGPAAELGLGVLGLHTGLIGTCWLVHLRLGTGRGFFADFGLAYQPGDWWRGLIGSFAARAGAIVMSLVALLWSTDFVGTNAEPYEDEVELTLPLVLLFGLVAVVLAPIVEELFFRGLLMRALETIVPAWIALLVQAVLFGLAHVTVDVGAGNVSVVLAITAAGLAFGIVARQFNRLAPAMFGHAWFNVLPFALVVVFYLTE
ncbi:MAG TPA: CPBP family intramembrane glutamic endopeptidase, partial [Acidimicrobiales bacterium]|nr:CPBP family intramembrane glutamic endopeptidase [Acidimicrobiales bacterium]